MNTKDALILALVDENQKLRELSRRSLPTVVIDNESFSFKAIIEDFRISIRKTSSIRFSWSYTDGLDLFVRCNESVFQNSCNEVVFQNSCIFFLADTAQSDALVQNRLSFLTRIESVYDEPIARLLLKIEMKDSGYSAFKIKPLYELVESFPSIPENSIQSESLYDKIATIEHPLFYTLQFEQRLREFCARHNLL